MVLDAAVGVVVQPTPPLHSSKRNKRRIDSHSTVGKRFSVRDGFHLRDRNQELRESIDRRLFPPPSEPSAEMREVSEEPKPHPGSTGNGPNVAQIPSRSHLGKPTDARAQVGDGSSSHAPVREINATNRIERIASILDRISMVGDDESREKPRVLSHRSPQSSTTDGKTTSVDVTKIEAAMLPSAEWLIYRHRPNASLQWQQVKMDKLLRDTLRKDEQQQSDGDNIAFSGPATCISLPRPRHQSTLGSTYAERVAAARQQRQQATHACDNQRLDVPGRSIVSASATEVERSLAHSREATNKDVDRLLVSLFQSPTHSLDASVVAKSRVMSPSTTPFATRRSELREQTAAALKSRKLLSRVDELRSLPDLIAKIESLQRLKHQQNVDAHGEDLVRKNRRQVRLSTLQRPVETPLFPSAIDQKLQLATKRKKELDDAQETAVRSAVSRWQKRRKEQQELQAKRFRESQWLLIVVLAQSSAKWLKPFSLFRKKRHALTKVLMAKRIQNCWRQNVLVRRNSLALLSFAPQTPLTSPFYRMPVVTKAISLLQRFTRRWLRIRRLATRRHAVAVIVTSWFEFQDVKFRRIILRFRKRVRDFQIMWREWRAITDARVKLLLLVWTKLERKIKRRHGLTAPAGDDGGDARASSPSSPRHAAPDESRVITLAEYFRLANVRDGIGGAAQSATPREHKRLEGVHRHLRNCGTVQAPIDVVAAAGNGSAAVGAGPTLSPMPSPVNSGSPTRGSPPKSQAPPSATKVVKRTMRLVHDMGEEFQLAMYDYYTAARIPKASNSGEKRGNASAASSPRKAASELGEPKRSPQQSKSPTPASQSPPAARGGRKAGSSPDKHVSFDSILAGIGGGPRQNEKVTLQLKTAVLRQLLSDKRRRFQETRERRRQEWTADRQHRRRVEFRYNVLDELAAFQRLQAEDKLFLLLHSVSEAEMVQLMHRAQQMANEAAAPQPPTSYKVPGAPLTHSSEHAPFRGRRSSSMVFVGGSSSAQGGPDAVSIISVGGARLERFDDDEQERAE